MLDQFDVALDPTFAAVDRTRLIAALSQALPPAALVTKTEGMRVYECDGLAAYRGLPAAVAADLKASRRPATMQPDEAAVYDFCMELATRHEVSDATFDSARKLLGDQGVVDLVAVSGTYVAIAMLLSAAEETVPPGKEEPFKPGEP